MIHGLSLSVLLLSMMLTIVVTRQENISRSSETNPAVIGAVDKAVAYRACNGGHVIITTNHPCNHNGQINGSNGHARVEPGVQLGETII